MNRSGRQGAGTETGYLLHQVRVGSLAWALSLGILTWRSGAGRPASRIVAGALASTGAKPAGTSLVPEATDWTHRCLFLWGTANSARRSRVLTRETAMIAW